MYDFIKSIRTYDINSEYRQASGLGKRRPYIMNHTYVMATKAKLEKASSRKKKKSGCMEKVNDLAMDTNNLDPNTSLNNNNGKESLKLEASSMNMLGQGKEMGEHQVEKDVEVMEQAAHSDEVEKMKEHQVEEDVHMEPHIQEMEKVEEEKLCHVEEEPMHHVEEGE